jgi:hypothetical protein
MWAQREKDMELEKLKNVRALSQELLKPVEPLYHVDVDKYMSMLQMPDDVPELPLKVRGLK